MVLFGNIAEPEIFSSKLPLVGGAKHFANHYPCRFSPLLKPI
jgi:hypothetical protein